MEMRKETRTSEDGVKESRYVKVYDDGTEVADDFWCVDNEQEQDNG